jgi:hypothetical protein
MKLKTKIFEIIIAVLLPTIAHAHGIELLPYVTAQPAVILLFILITPFIKCSCTHKLLMTIIFAITSFISNYSVNDLSFYDHGLKRALIESVIPLMSWACCYGFIVIRRKKREGMPN